MQNETPQTPTESTPPQVPVEPSPPSMPAEPTPLQAVTPPSVDITPRLQRIIKRSSAVLIGVIAAVVFTYVLTTTNSTSGIIFMFFAPFVLIPLALVGLLYAVRDITVLPKALKNGQIPDTWKQRTYIAIGLSVIVLVFAITAIVLTGPSLLYYLLPKN